MDFIESSKIKGSLKLASQNETTVMTVGCRPTTIMKLQDVLKSGFRLFRLMKIEIDRVIGEFLLSVQRYRQIAVKNGL